MSHYATTNPVQSLTGTNTTADAMALLGRVLIALIFLLSAY